MFSSTALSSQSTVYRFLLKINNQRTNSLCFDSNTDSSLYLCLSKSKPSKGSLVQRTTDSQEGGQISFYVLWIAGVDSSVPKKLS